MDFIETVKHQNGDDRYQLAEDERQEDDQVVDVQVRREGVLAKQVDVVIYDEQDLLLDPNYPTPTKTAALARTSGRQLKEKFAASRCCRCPSEKECK